MYRELLTFIALICINVLGFRVTGVAIGNPRRSSYWDPSRFVPLSHLMPGGQGVTYLSDLTQNLADDMSSQIALGGQQVSAVGQAIENHEDAKSEEIQHVSDIVDSNYKSTAVDNEEEEQEINEGDGYEENEAEY
ncbi:uncharacterized protein LOC116288098 [Actinia tenebrosa]|uniref:Uncharacterized protein LOC116288098 n=1 Tax=Actinia tenebrosa TaxID=6105 RepID=A0A6P8H2S3_ACTTE|nr:uncharacterized protein LOC116288098 [Actinia tenebrosa]